MMKRSYQILILIVLFMVLAACSADPQDSQELSANELPIRVGESIEDLVENHFVTIGEVVPRSQVDVTLSSQGTVKSVFVKPGTYVEVDSPLILIENDLAETTLATNESQLRTIRDNLAIAYNAALEDYQKQKSLYDSGVVSKNQLDFSFDQLMTIQHQYEDARTNYMNQVNKLKDSVEDLTVKSPIKGQVASVTVDEGQVSAGQMAVTIIDNAELFVETMIPVELKRIVSVGDIVELKTETEVKVKGVVDEIDELPDAQLRLFMVRVLITEPGQLIVGDFTEVTFTTETYTAHLIPAKAIVRKGIEQYIWILEDEVLVKLNVETGLSKDEWVEIKNLTRPVTLVTSGHNNLSENDSFVIVD